MNNVSSLKVCYGCGLCATVCNKGAVKIGLNANGFYTPEINLSACTECGLCIDVCAYLNRGIANNNRPLSSYGAWSNNSDTRLQCSSGGVAIELGKFLISQGYKVCSVKYNVNKVRAEHYVASNEDELKDSIGSKYIQSYTVDAFKAVSRKEKYLITGTPCQIDSFRRYIRKFKVEDNFILMDFFCHSVPSMLAWKKYLQIKEKYTGPLTSVVWRNKLTGWHDSWQMSLIGTSSKSQSWFSRGDLFYQLFLGDYCCNPACVKDCKFKYNQSSADIRIGDFWGDTYRTDEKGVSAVVTFTERGNAIIKSLDCTLIEHPFEIVAEGQMKRNAGTAYTAPFIMKALKDDTSDENTFRFIFRMERVFRSPIKLFNRISRVLCLKK